MSSTSSSTRLSLLKLLAASSAFPIPISVQAIQQRASVKSSLPNCTASSISWGTCPPQASLPPNLQCASFAVPIDWDHPNGTYFDLGLVKLPATGSNSTFSTIGNLFLNPGGPGVPASAALAGFASGQLQSNVLFASFDIIAVDPRGVGFSNLIKCDASIYAERVSLFPQNEQEFERLVDKNKRLGQSCRNLTGPLVDHLDTISAAKDYEAVRIALGNEPMNFLGLSYGSQLGAQYASLFPDNIRTMALDAILQHSQSEASNLYIESTSYELVLKDFFAWAGTNNASALQGQDVEAVWTSLLAKGTNGTLPAPLCDGIRCRTNVNAEELLFNAQVYLTFAGTQPLTSWALLASALYNATNGDASTLSTSFVDPTALAFLGVGCLDWTHSDTFATTLDKQLMATTYSPLTRGASQMWTWQHACIGWPVPVRNPPKKLNVHTNATILMTQSTADPETPLPWAIGMLEELHNSVLVLREGYGHTSFPLLGDTAGVIVQYLVTGVAPEAGLVLQS